MRIDVRGFVSADEGQDLIEYALLSGIIGLVGLLVYPTIVEKMSDAYADWIADSTALWVPCPPGGC
jgi:hypothetical protein